MKRYISLFRDFLHIKEQKENKIYKSSGDPYEYKIVDGMWWTKGPKIPDWKSLSDNPTAISILDKRHPEARGAAATSNSSSLSSPVSASSSDTSSVVTTGVSPVTVNPLGPATTVQAEGWSGDGDFFTLKPEGINLSAIGAQSESGLKSVKMQRNMGKGNSFTMSDEAEYQRLKNNPSVHWAVYDISGDRVIAHSSNAKENVYGASVPKALVSAAALHNQGGRLKGESLGSPEKEWKNMINLMVPSANDPAWTRIQNIAGGKNAVNSFSSVMGYTMEPGRPGGKINALDMVKFYRDLIRGKFKGADALFRIASSCTTSGKRSKYYLPTNVPMGGKTGTFKNVNHDTGFFKYNGRWYSIAVLTTSSNGASAVAKMWGGLFNEYVKGVSSPGSSVA